MLRPYAIDAHTRALDLTSSVISSSSPASIVSAISSADSFLRKLSADQSRSFFSIAFPAIICRIFGFDDSNSNPASTSSASTSWIDQAHHDPELDARLLALLSPDGPLLSAISSADRLGLVKYVFPAERLPEWIKFALQNDRCSSVLSDLCPIFRGRIKEDNMQGTRHLHLNAFEYYMLWFAYYPVCRGDFKSSDGFCTQKSRRKSRLEGWKSSLPGIVNPSRRSAPKAEVCLYSKLLYSYLCVFVPKDVMTFNQPYPSSLLHYSSSCDISLFEQAEFIVHSLIHFWFVDNDFSPLPIAVCRSYNISFLHQPALVETPPTAGLGEMGMLFVKYLISCLSVRATATNQMALRYVGTSSMRYNFSVEGSSWSSAIQRPLYRFMLRTFLFFPIGTSMKNVSHVVSMWVSYMEPWRSNLEDFIEFELPVVCKFENSEMKLKQEKIIGENERRSPLSAHTPPWEDYVASNYLFYSSLVAHFLRFAHKVLHSNTEAVMDMVLKVLNVLTSSKELIDLLHKFDSAFHSKQSRLYSLDNVEKYAQSICHHLKDWEDGLCEIDTNGSFSRENWSQDYELFNGGENSPLKLLQLLVFRAEHEMYAYPANRTQSFRQIDQIKAQIGILFDAAAIEAQPNSTNSIRETSARCIRKNAFAPKHPGFETGRRADVDYKGDWMHRPVSDMEIAWLARLLIKFSDRLNDLIDLRRTPESSHGWRPAYAPLADSDWSFAGGPKGFAIEFISFIGSWLGLCGDLVLGFMRGHGIRVNLRVFSSKKFFMFLMVYVIGHVLKKKWYDNLEGQSE